MSWVRKLLGILLFVGLVLAFVSAATMATNKYRKQQYEQKAQLINRLKELKVKFSQETGNPKLAEAPEVTWDKNTAIDPSLELQKLLSKIAQDNDVQELLLGPYDETSIDQIEFVSVEFETETSLKKLSTLLEDLENQNPPLAIPTIDIRRMSVIDEQNPEVLVFARMVIGGYFQVLHEVK